MNGTPKPALVIAFVAVVLLFLLLSSAMLSGGMMGNSIPGRGMMGGMRWMWLPTLLTLGLGVLLAWGVWAKK